MGFAVTFVIFMRSAGEKMSKLIVREKLRDLFKNMLSVEESLEVKEAISDLYGVFLDKDPFLAPMLIRHAEGYSVEEISEHYAVSREQTQSMLEYAYGLLGDLLMLDDAIVLRRIPQGQKEAAAKILDLLYREGTEL